MNTLVSSEDVDDRFDELWRRASPSQSVIAVRDASFLRWRYFERTAEKDRFCLTASEHGVLVGYLVLVLKKKRSEQIGIVADAFSLPSRAILERLLHATLAFCATAQPTPFLTWNYSALFSEVGL